MLWIGFPVLHLPDTENLYFSWHHLTSQLPGLWDDTGHLRVWRQTRPRQRSFLVGQRQFKGFSYFTLALKNSPQRFRQSDLWPSKVLQCFYRWNFWSSTVFRWFTNLVISFSLKKNKIKLAKIHIPRQLYNKYARKSRSLSDVNKITRHHIFFFKYPLWLSPKNSGNCLFQVLTSLMRLCQKETIKKIQVLGMKK